MLDADEFAHRLRDHPEIREACVLPDGDGRVIAAVEPDGFVYGPVLRDAVLDLAPGDEERIVVLIVAGMPTAADGRADRAAVAARAAELAARPHSPWLFRFEPARTESEQALEAVLLELLDCRRISLGDDLAVLGADSIMIVELVEELHTRFGARFEGIELFNAGSIREIARLIEDRA